MFRQIIATVLSYDPEAPTDVMALLGFGGFCSHVLVGAEVRKHRIHLQNDRKFGLFTHGNAFSSPALGMEAVARFGPEEVCHKSHKFAVPSVYFYLL